MLRIVLSRLQQGHRTSRYPEEPPVLPDRFRGRPTMVSSLCPDRCGKCAAACPTGAIPSAPEGDVGLDLGRCLFCGECEQACSNHAIAFSLDHRLATSRREDLVYRGGTWPRAAALDEARRKLLARSLKLRVVSAGGCNACESDVNVLGTIAFDIGRFGIQYVASPRHADGLLVVGPVTDNMKEALRKTWEAVPEPRVVIAVGACAISGGPFARDQPVQGAESVVPVDLFIPGCPPHPYTILDGLLRFLGRSTEPRSETMTEAGPGDTVRWALDRAEDALRYMGWDTSGPSDPSKRH